MCRSAGTWKSSLSAQGTRQEVQVAPCARGVECICARSSYVTALNWAMKAVGTKLCHVIVPKGWGVASGAGTGVSPGSKEWYKIQEMSREVVTNTEKLPEENFPGWKVCIYEIQTDDSITKVDKIQMHKALLIFSRRQIKKYLSLCHVPSCRPVSMYWPCMHTSLFQCIPPALWLPSWERSLEDEGRRVASFCNTTCAAFFLNAQPSSTRRT